MANKVNKKPAMKNEKNPKYGSCYITMGKFLLISVVFGGLLAWYINKRFTSIPEMPHLDPNEWWGPYPIDLNVDETLQPYKIEFSDVMVNDLRERLLHHRPFTPPLENVGFQYGFNSKFLTQILHYWKNNYNFKEREDHLNRYDHFMTNIQGLNIHYMHVKPEDASDVEVVPLLMMHGWPGSICEFYDIIPKLTTPRPGYKFVFELIIPSLPGFGFSQGAVRSGLGAPQIAVIMNNLMRRIGREKYYVQGGDLGHVVASIMATLYPNNVLGFHTNLPVVVFNPYTSLTIMLGSLWPNLTVEAEEESRMYPFMDHLMRLVEESGYMHIQATKPDTVGIGLSDSPAGLAAYILEKFSTWTNPESKNSGDGNLLDKFPLTYLLDNVMMYWASNSITTSMRVYAETLSSKDQIAFDMNPTDVPTWGIKFKHELMYQPDYVLKKKYRKYLHTTLVDDGGHFAAMENPDLLADDIFYAVTTFIEFHKEQTQQADPQPDTEKSPQTVYEFTVKDLNGRDVKLEKYRGYVLLIVNVASECGLTDSNYHQLNELYEKYRDRGLRILAFPCNQFGSQEPGDAKEIFSFTKKKGVKFDVFQKIDVNGDNAHPLWKFLKSAQGGTLGDFIKWNFSKFIVDRNGVPVERLAPNVSPLELEPYLAKYW